MFAVASLCPLTLTELVKLFAACAVAEACRLLSSPNQAPFCSPFWPSACCGGASKRLPPCDHSGCSGFDSTTPVVLPVLGDYINDRNTNILALLAAKDQILRVTAVKHKFLDRESYIRQYVDLCCKTIDRSALP
jgi:hypothetical protein